MPSFDQTFSFSEPTVVLPPSFSHPFHQRPFNTPRNFSKAPFLAKASPTLPWNPQSQSQTPITKSRKRSRDEAADNLSDDNSDHIASSPILAPEHEDEWQYGEGMTLTKPNGFIIDASSQTGTWVEEKEEQAEKESQSQIINSRPELRNTKLQRLDNSATPFVADEIVSTFIASSPPKPTEPTIDDFTIHLGIGWSRISSDDHIQAAARGWAKFIENNYPVTAPVIQLESRGLNSYLVEAKEGFFLFGEDLKRGRLVAQRFGDAVRNLKVNPPVFEGEEVLLARDGGFVGESEKGRDAFVTATEITNIVGSNEMDIEMDMN